MCMYSDPVDKNYISECCMRQSRDISRDLESFPVGAYSDAVGRCLYTDLSAADCLLLSDRYPPPSNAVTPAAFQRPSFESYPPALHDANAARPVSSHGNMTPDDSGGYSQPVPTHCGAAACDGGSWQAWKDWASWNADGGGASFPANYDDNDDDNVLQVSGGEQHLSWRRSRGAWTNAGHDFTTSFAPSSLTAGAARRSQLAAYWNGDCSPGSSYPCASNYVVPYYEAGGGSGTSTNRPAGPSGYCSLAQGCTESSRFYESQCCYAPAASTSLSTDAQQHLTPVSCQSAVYQSSCKYSRVAEAHCRLYSAADSAPSFVNTA